MEHIFVFGYREFVTNYFLSTLETVFMILAIYTYNAIFKKVKESRAKNEEKEKKT